MDKKEPEDQQGDHVINERYDIEDGTQTLRPRSIPKTVEYGCCGVVLIIFSFIFFVITIPFSLFCAIRIVEEYKRAVIMRLGRLTGGARGPDWPTSLTWPLRNVLCVAVHRYLYPC